MKIRTKNNKLIKIAILIILVNSIIESFLLKFDNRTFIISAQFVLNISFIIGFFLSQKRILKSKVNLILGAIIFLTICTSLFSSNKILTFNFALKFIIPFFFWIIGFNLIENRKKLDILIKWLWVFLLYFVIYIIVCNVFSIGERYYKNGLIIGYYSLNGIYIPCFSILIILFNYHRIPNKLIRRLSILSMIMATIIFIILLKRTLVLTILAGYVFYFLRNSDLIKVLRLSFIAMITLFCFSIFFSNKIESLVSTRVSRFNKDYTITNEGRYKENEMLYDLLKDSYFKILLGSGEVFNDRVYFSNEYQITRQAHNSFIRVLWNGGVIGLSLFLFFYLFQLYALNKFRLKSKRTSIQLSNLFYMGLIFVTLRFINEFSSGITYLSYNAFSYLIIGGLFRQGIQIKKQYIKQLTP